MAMRFGRNDTLWPWLHRTIRVLVIDFADRFRQARTSVSKHHWLGRILPGFMIGDWLGSRGNYATNVN